MEQEINPTYFIAGAIFSLSALALILLISVRGIFRLQHAITQKPIDWLCWLLLASGTVVGYAYLMELFMAYYSASKYEGDAFTLRAIYGPSAWYFGIVLVCFVIGPQLFWFRWARRNSWVVLAVALAATAGMLYERYVVYVSQ